MSLITNQKIQSLRFGESSVVATVVKLTATSDTVDLPDMKANSNCIVQLRRPEDPLVTVSQSDIDTVALTGVIGDEVLLVSLHSDPPPEPRS